MHLRQFLLLSTPRATESPGVLANYGLLAPSEPALKRFCSGRSNRLPESLPRGRRERLEKGRPQDETSPSTPSTGERLVDEPLRRECSKCLPFLKVQECPHPSTPTPQPSCFIPNCCGKDEPAAAGKESRGAGTSAFRWAGPSGRGPGADAPGPHTGSASVGPAYRFGSRTGSAPGCCSPRPPARSGQGQACANHQILRPSKSRNAMISGGAA